jgi:glycosyltransferase involved in cell wall biosynthesis
MDKMISMAAGRSKVVHLTSVHGASDPRITDKECATLAQEGYEVVVIAPGPQHRLPASIRHREVRAPRSRLERFFRTILEVYRAAIDERGDVYHFHDPELIGVGIALRLRGARVVFDVHEDLALDVHSKAWIHRAARAGVGAFATLVLRCAQRCFSAIVPATPSIADAFSHRRTVVVRNYPRLERLRLNGAARPFEQRPMTALYLGSITLARGVEQMVRAMSDARMPSQARLLLAGDFEDDALRAWVAALPGWKRVHAPGRIGEDRIGPALASARAGLVTLLPIPSFERSLPTKLFEYMAAGTPVIASKFLLVAREIIEEHACGILVDPRDSDEIADALIAIFSRVTEAEAMGRRGQAAVRGRYEWASEARQLVALYAELTG